MMDCMDASSYNSIGGRVVCTQLFQHSDTVSSLGECGVPFQRESLGISTICVENNPRTLVGTFLYGVVHNHCLHIELY